MEVLMNESANEMKYDYESYSNLPEYGDDIESLPTTTWKRNSRVKKLGKKILKTPGAVKKRIMPSRGSGSNSKGNQKVRLSKMNPNELINDPSSYYELSTEERKKLDKMMTKEFFS